MLKIKKTFEIIEKFAKKNEIRIFENNSTFPEHFATHEIKSENILNEDKLLSANLLESSNQSYEIDKYLGTTKYVFFALGKGYLKSKNSLGLVYDPFALTKKSGTNIVMNDLLHVLSKTEILNEFCNKNLKTLLEVLANHYMELHINKPINKILELFNKSLSQGVNLLIADSEEEKLFGNSFELILKHLPDKQKTDLKHILNEKIIIPNTITGNLESKIIRIFKKNTNLTNKFFDETKEEQLIELRVPSSHRISEGLVGIYHS
ncbi:hypothetical protein GF340_05915 [Candidatus Peregrinibacteria bacterium]|nr:hypothetical protein [Candidatus Peregrinibacteria bacterium]